MQLYMSWYIRSIFGFTFLNILYFFKYACTNFFHRHSPHTFYSNSLFEASFNLISKLWYFHKAKCRPCQHEKVSSLTKLSGRNYAKCKYVYLKQYHVYISLKQLHTLTVGVVTNNSTLCSTLTFWCRDRNIFDRIRSIPRLRMTWPLVAPVAPFTNMV